ncbi:unnamed protein product [Prorocentrum cordatum]|uniref:Uncharacterized protein n=1 Tax=Prorocentrum cordatum TaxID=2364126 RepID=A0ABN9TVS0_9DINO|nr:unnamed protein product [Polarella glacialis]
MSSRPFAQHLYSDDFSQVQTRMGSHSAKKPPGGREDGGTATAEVAFLLGVLSASRKYQVSRLTLWCKQKFSDSISMETACAMWMHAYLLEAKHLEECCLSYINRNMATVSSRPSFARLSTAP